MPNRMGKRCKLLASLMHHPLVPRMAIRNEAAMGDRKDLLIIGGGLVGMTLALAVARTGCSSHVVDQADPAELTAEGSDGRASALSTARWNLFNNIGVGEALEPFNCTRSEDGRLGNRGVSTCRSRWATPHKK